MDWLEKCRNWDILDFRLFNSSLTCDAMTRSSEGSRGSSNTHSKMRGSEGNTNIAIRDDGVVHEHDGAEWGNCDLGSAQ